MSLHEQALADPPFRLRRVAEPVVVVPVELLPQRRPRDFPGRPDQPVVRFADEARQGNDRVVCLHARRCRRRLSLVERPREVGGWCVFGRLLLLLDGARDLAGEVDVRAIGGQPVELVQLETACLDVAPA
jgi:hypothetical protein